jgi:hypothetical protein
VEEKLQWDITLLSTTMYKLENVFGNTDAEISVTAILFPRCSYIKYTTLTTLDIIIWRFPLGAISEIQTCHKTDDSIIQIRNSEVMA